VDAVAVPVAPGEDGVQPRAGTADLAARYGIDLADLAERAKMDGSAGEVHTLHLPLLLAGDPPWADLTRRIVLVGVGGGRPADLRRAGAALAGATRGLRRVVSTLGTELGPAATRAVVEGYLLGAYRPPRASATPGPGPAGGLVLLDQSQRAVEAARRDATATWIARTLTETPSSTKTPAWLADQAVAAAASAGLRATVLDPTELAARGFGGLLAVGSGSAAPPRLVVVAYDPPKASRHVVIVGKGITFDTGGLSIKPRDSMVAMKTDMAGAAVALAVVLGAAEARVRHRVTAVLPLAENAVGASSYRPGDVIRAYGGTSIEVLNTDAEGRLVLADALGYADAELDPDFLIDVATLTGAATAGLGRQHGALFTPDDDLAAALLAAGADSGEPLWRLPLVADYRRSLESSVADVAHVATDRTVGGGAITAALFLQRFVGRRRWAHLDIAGPARSSSARHEVPEGATGFGARLLLRWLLE
jgi:leucyl aminopeptidase